MRRKIKTELKKSGMESKRKKAPVKSARKEILPPKENPNFEANFKAVIENAGIGIAVISKDGKISIANSALSKMLGYSPKESLRLSLRKLSHPGDFAAVVQIFRDVMRGKKSKFQTEERFLTKSGEVRNAKLTVSAVDDKKTKSKNIIVIVEDITDQKKISETFEKEQNLFTKLLELLPESIYFKDLESRFIKTNNALALKHGFRSPDLIIGKSDKDTFGTEHASETKIDEQNIIRTGEPIIGKEEKEDWPDGRTTWGLTTKLPLYDKNNKIIGTFGITRDITHTKQMQESLHESEQIYHSLFDGSDDGMLLISSGKIIDCNQALQDIFKYDRESILGKTPAYFSPEFQPDGKSSLEESHVKMDLTLVGLPQRFYWRHKRKDGSFVDCDISLRTLIISGKKIIHGTVRDITEIKRAEKFRQILYDISETVYTAPDMDSMYRQIHEKVAQLVPVKNIYIALFDEKTDMISFPYFVDEFDPPQKPKKLGTGLTEYILRKGEAELINAQRDLDLRRSGEVELIGEPAAIWLGVPLKVYGKTIGVIVVQDYEDENAYGEEEMQVLIFVSEQIAHAIERKRASESIKTYAEELKQLNNTKDKFFSIIAHDLRNPFITILGFSDLLVSDYEDLSDEEKLFYISEMKKSAETSHNLLQNLLQWSRSQTGRIEYNPAALNLAELVLSNVNLLNPHASRKNITIRSSVPENLSITADEDMLNTIMRNLITNAIKFTETNGRIDINCGEEQDKITVCVADTGVGMSASVKEKLFKADETRSTAGTAQESGTGLGLILCKEFVEKHGGNITVESEIGKGSKFCFSLPKTV